MRCLRVVVTALALAGCVAADEEAEPDPITPSAWEIGFTATLAEPHPCPTTAPGADDRIGEVLAAHGLDRSIGIPRSRYEAYGGRIAEDPTRLDFFHRLQEDPFQLPCFAGNVATRSDLAVDSDHPITRLIADGVLSIDLDLELGGPTPELDLLPALDRLYDDDDWEGRDDFIDRSDAVPPAVLQAAGRIVAAAQDAVELRNEAMEAMTDPLFLARFFDIASNHWLQGDLGDFNAPAPLNPDGETAAGLFLADADGAGVLYRGAVILSRAIDELDLPALAGGGPGPT
jgi:hypothetical protein